jgi:transposase
MVDSSVPLPSTVAACHAWMREMAAAYASLQEVNAQQEATIEQQQVTIAEQQAILQTLQLDIALMKRTLFGQRRERFEDPRQGLLFDALEIGKPEQGDSVGEEDDAIDDDASENAEGKLGSRRTGRKRRVIPEGLPRTQVVHELDENEIPEDLQGEAVRRFLKKVGEYVDWEPPRLTVVEEYVEMLAADNADATQTTMLSASRSPRIINCFAGPGLFAGLAVQHFADHLPYYRLEEILTRSRLEIDRSTQCRWMIRVADQLTPLTDLMRSLALQSLVVQADETPVKMLVPGRGKTKTTCLWAVLGDEQHPYTTFSFTENRERAGPIEFFADFSGVLVSDAYIGYECLPPRTHGRIRLAGCWVHARRKFEELRALGSTKAIETALGFFQRLFDIEDELRCQSVAERHAQRKLRSRPVVAEFKRWLDNHLETLRPKHELRGAISYMTTRWECFERFLESGAIPLDNNASEQAVKNPVMGKKAWLFLGSEAGGHSAAVFYTLTATCRRLKIDPYAYLQDVFKRLPECDPNDPASLTPLLPDRWLAEHPEGQLQIRVAESNNKAARRRTDRARRRKAFARATQKRR